MTRKHNVTLDGRTLAQIAEVAAKANAARVQIMTDERDDLTAVWFHEPDDVTWRRLRGPWTADPMDVKQS